MNRIQQSLEMLASAHFVDRSLFSVTSSSTPQRVAVCEAKPPDAELVRRMAAGDRDALGVLFDRHAEAALGLAQRILGNRQDAEDLVHDAFLEIWQKASSYEPRRAGVRAWVFVRIRSRAIDRLRALDVARRHSMAVAAKPAPPPSFAANPEATADARRARSALEALSEEQRSVIELAYFEGLTLREVAERQSIPLGTAKSRLSAALNILRLQLDPSNRNDSGEMK